MEEIQEIGNSFDEGVDIIQTYSIETLQPTPNSSSQPIQILQNYSVVKNSVEDTNLETLLLDIESSDLNMGIKEALLNPLQSIDADLTTLEFSTTSEITVSFFLHLLANYVKYYGFVTHILRN